MSSRGIQRALRIARHAARTVDEEHDVALRGRVLRGNERQHFERAAVPMERRARALAEEREPAAAAAKEAAAMMKKDLAEPWDKAVDHIRKAFQKNLARDLTRQFGA